MATVLNFNIQDTILCLTQNLFIMVLCATLALFIVVKKRKVNVYLLDYTCYRPPDSHRLPTSMFCEYVHLEERMDEESKALQVKIIEKSGYSEETCIPPSLGEAPAKRSVSLAIEEAETVIFSAVEDLLKKTNVSPWNIDILVINSSLFTPVPSLTAMVVNKFRMRSNILSYNLSGMGCSAGIVSVSLARDLLGVHKNSLALVVSTEILNRNWYTGKNKSMLITNCLFRTGCAALLMSNRGIDKKKAKYILQHIVRTNRAQDDQSYNCVYQDVDSEGNIGVSISKSLTIMAADALRINMISLGKLALPYSEQLWYACSVVQHKLRIGGRTGISIPNFKKAFEHFCIHAGGKAVIKAIEKNLRLSKEDVEASMMTLYKFGNTSSSSVWYELAYIEATGRMKRGDRVWQIALGSGFKCNSAVWRCLRAAHSKEDTPWKGKLEPDQSH